MNIPEELQISVYHEGVLLLLAYSSYDHLIPVLSRKKRELKLIEEIAQFADKQLMNEYSIETISVSNTKAWTRFLRELKVVCRKYNESHPLVLGSVIEIMQELNWQEQLNIRKLLTFFLDTNEELAHLKLATAGSELAYLENWRENIIDEARGYAAYKSKIA